MSRRGSNPLPVESGSRKPTAAASPGFSPEAENGVFVSNSVEEPGPVTSQGESNAATTRRLSKSPQTQVHIFPTPQQKPKQPPSPFHIGLHEVMPMPPDDDLKPPATPTSTLATARRKSVVQPNIKRKASVQVGRKRRKSIAKGLTAAEQAALAMNREREAEAEERIRKFEAAKERGE